VEGVARHTSREAAALARPCGAPRAGL